MLSHTWGHPATGLSECSTSYNYGNTIKAAEHRCVQKGHSHVVPIQCAGG